jgi:hypothetical protein
MTSNRPSFSTSTAASPRTSSAARSPYRPQPVVAESLESDLGFSESELSDTYEGYYADRDRNKASRGSAKKLTSGGGNTGGSNARAKRNNLPGLVTSRGKSSGSRAVSRTPISRYASDEEQDGEEGENNGEERGRERAMSPVVTMSSARKDELEDDEVERRDRGEELVRKRMKERARMKKVQSIPSNATSLTNTDLWSSFP